MADTMENAPIFAEGTIGNYLLVLLWLLFVLLWILHASGCIVFSSVLRGIATGAAAAPTARPSSPRRTFRVPSAESSPASSPASSPILRGGRTFRVPSAESSPASSPLLRGFDQGAPGPRMFVDPTRPFAWERWPKVPERDSLPAFNFTDEERALACKRLLSRPSRAVLRQQQCDARAARINQVRFVTKVTEIAPPPPPPSPLDAFAYNEARLRLAAALDVPDVWFFPPPAPPVAAIAPTVNPVSSAQSFGEGTYPSGPPVPILDHPVPSAPVPTPPVPAPPFPAAPSGDAPQPAPVPTWPAPNDPFRGTIPARSAPSAGDNASQAANNPLWSMSSLTAANQASDWMWGIVDAVEKIRKSGSRSSPLSAWRAATNDNAKRTRLLTVKTRLNYICDWAALPGGKVDTTKIPQVRWDASALAGDDFALLVRDLTGAATLVSTQVVRGASAAVQRMQTLFQPSNI